MPGWTALLPMQRLLLEQARLSPARSDVQVLKGLEWIERLQAAGSGVLGNATLLEQLRKGSSTSGTGGAPDRAVYLAHEYLNANWQPQYHMDTAALLAERRKVLTEMESKTLLSAFHIPVTQTLLARNANEAMMIATQLGFPVALKIDSPDISHKSDVQGVALNIQSGAAARDTFNEMVARVKRLQPLARINGVTVQKMARAQRGRGGHEVCVGLVTDEAFGPTIVFGAGGTMIVCLRGPNTPLPLTSSMNTPCKCIGCSIIVSLTNLMRTRWP
eukprot:gene52490-64150_t